MDRGGTVQQSAYNSLRPFRLTRKMKRPVSKIQPKSKKKVENQTGGGFMSKLFSKLTGKNDQLDSNTSPPAQRRLSICSSESDDSFRSRSPPMRQQQMMSSNQIPMQ